MFTIFDLIAVLLTVLCIMIGLCIGKAFGIGWAVISAIIGGLIGVQLGRLPTIIMVRNARRKLANFTVDELLEELYNPNRFNRTGYAANFLLLELRARGEDITEHIDLVLSMMESESLIRRKFGYAALLSAYPYLARQIKRYNPQNSVEDCSKKVTELKRKIKS